VASSVGCRRREDIADVRDGRVGCSGGRVRRTVGRRVSRSEANVGLFLGSAMVCVVWWLLMRSKVMGRRGSFFPVKRNINCFMVFLLVFRGI
jgi:hypothetical protein